MTRSKYVAGGAIPISRRAVLRGAGALLALPFLESFGPWAGTQAATPPLRMGIVTVTGGTVIESWTPAEVGPLNKLPSILRPLEALKDELLVISGLSHGGRSENTNGHETCAFAHLTGAPVVRKEGGKIFAGISVDQVAAETVGRQTFLPSLEIGLSNHETRYSFRSADAPLPYEGNPRLVFDRMFRGRKPVVPNWNRRATAAASPVDTSESLEQGVVDLVLEEAKDLRRQVGRVDQRKLDQYLESVRATEKRIAFVEARQREDLLDLAAGASQAIAPQNLPRPGTPIWEVTNPVHRDPEKHADYIRLMSDLFVLAFQTDTTRVATLAVGSDEAMFPGVVTVGSERHCHTLEHQGNSFRPEDADPIAREACRQIHAWYTLLFAEMLTKMKAIDEGGSSLLDNCLILYTSYMADGNHGREQYPALLAGRAGGSVRPGRHIAFPDKAPMANLYLEMAQRMGAPLESFGDSHTSRFAGSLAGKLPGLV